MATSLYAGLVGFLLVAMRSSWDGEGTWLDTVVYNLVIFRPVHRGANLLISFMSWMSCPCFTKDGRGAL